MTSVQDPLRPPAHLPASPLSSTPGDLRGLGSGVHLDESPIFLEMMLRGPTSAQPWVIEGGHKMDSVFQLFLRALDFKGLLVPRGHNTQVSELMAEVGPE